MKNPFRTKYKNTNLSDHLREFEAELEAKGDPAGDRRTKEWEEAKQKFLDNNPQLQEGFLEQEKARKEGYQLGYQHGYADGKDSQKFGSRHTSRNQHPNG